MTLNTTIRYEHFHSKSDNKEWVNFTTMVHNGKEFIVYEFVPYDKAEMFDFEWDRLMERIEKFKASPVCVANIWEGTDCDCTTYSMSTYTEG